MTPSGVLPSSLGSAFRVAVGELGPCSASWLFVREVAAEGGDPLVEALRREHGPAWPVLDAVCAGWLDGARPAEPDVAPLLAAIGAARRVVCVGVETRWLDALVAATELPVALVRQSVFAPDWERVAANYRGRVALEPLDTFQRLGGPKSVLVTFGYGADGHTVHVLPAWIRVAGEDVRTQFRSLVAWEVLGRPFDRWPRWLVGVPAGSFSAIVT